MWSETLEFSRSGWFSEKRYSHSTCNAKEPLSFYLSVQKFCSKYFFPSKIGTQELSKKCLRVQERVPVGWFRLEGCFQSADEFGAIDGHGELLPEQQAGAVVQQLHLCTFVICHFGTLPKRTVLEPLGLYQ